MAGEDDNDRTIVRKVRRPGGSRVPQPGGRPIREAEELGDKEEPVRTIVRGREPRPSRADDATVPFPPDPKPSGRTEQRRAASAGRARRPAVPARADLPPAAHAGPDVSNILLEEASPLLALGGYLSSADRPDDLDQLRGEITSAVGRYRESIEPHYSESTLREASFCLCAFLDDCVIRTFWGRESQWALQSILAEVHQTAHRHSLIEQIQDQLQATSDPDLLALYHTVLSLGFQGLEDDERAIRILRNDVYRAVGQHLHRANYLVDESIVSADAGKALARRLPAWTVLAAAGVVVLALFAGFRYLLRPSVAAFEANASALADAQTQLTVQAFFPEVEPPAPPMVDLYQLLKDEIEREELELFAAQPGTRIFLRSDEMFASGSANMRPSITPLLETVAHALDETTGVVRVEGHTDSVPFRSALTTNQRLSTERAEQVVAVMSRQLQDGDARLRARGVADRAPVECGKSKAALARNRRVEILLEGVETRGAPPMVRPDCSRGVVP